jgi:hypothetical protein
MEFEAATVMLVETVALAFSPTVWVVQLVVRPGLLGVAVRVVLPKKLLMLVKLTIRVDEVPGWSVMVLGIGVIVNPDDEERTRRVSLTPWEWPRS